ncbi:hypothetical protein NLX67_17400 [Domibacillus sp. A3M-37]|uniref:hypothetical protein n=1 Tax=Domibacillus sp. A3M-37 TaxID=2962037 RepID=UPI0020B8DF7F|nr:hypothetical protein [Domibacillus sp. A3M-37]MCP3764128.1 hypothetical protein [Domibacillus sp. A3M-37]
MKKGETPKVSKKVLKGFNADDIYSITRPIKEARNKAIIAMLVDCGLRAMELCPLTIESVGETSILVQ